MIKVTSFYKFFPISKNSLQNLKQILDDRGQSLKIRGLILLGEEGINATFSGEENHLEKYKKDIEEVFKRSFSYKDSYCEKWNFKLLSIKIKKEIIHIGQSYFQFKTYENPSFKVAKSLTDSQKKEIKVDSPKNLKEEASKNGMVACPETRFPSKNLSSQESSQEKSTDLTPSEWENKMKEDVQILDVRNSYEVNVGKFKQAQILDMESFKQFPNKIEDCPLDKKKETLIYCTGGIRCEKALKVMRQKGFEKVFQLKGGILNYLQKYPNSYFEGECFVFDHRVSLNQTLKASKKYSLCPHCGQPGDVSIFCSHCAQKAMVCSSCLKKQDFYKTCSKNCAYHFKLGHKCRSKNKPLSF